MKIAFTTKGTSWDSAMDPRFGRSDFFIIYDEKTDLLEILDNRDSAQEAHGAGPNTAQKLMQFKPEVIITGNGPGGNAKIILQKMGLLIYIGAGDMTAREAYEAYNNNLLNKL